MRNNTGAILAIGLLVLAAAILVITLVHHPAAPSAQNPSLPIDPLNPPAVFSYTFDTPGILYEAGSSGESTSPYWWVNSGGKLIIANHTGATIEGSLAEDDPWRLLYAKNNPTDTDNGYHPQNIFRLVTKYEWTDYTEEAYFKIDANNLSASPNRNQSNGILLFNRYQDHNNLYYTGLRVDGNAVIKKKINGTYYTMALNPLFPGTYGPSASPNLLPLDTWIGLRTVLTSGASGSVAIKFYIDVGDTGHWILAAQATDNGTAFGGRPIAGPGFLGIRTDFMDVEFADFKVTRS